MRGLGIKVGVLVFLVLRFGVWGFGLGFTDTSIEEDGGRKMEAIVA